MTEAEKRERRALERKLSEMEEELKVSIDFLSLRPPTTATRPAAVRGALLLLLLLLLSCGVCRLSDSIRRNFVSVLQFSLTLRRTPIISVIRSLSVTQSARWTTSFSSYDVEIKLIVMPRSSSSPSRIVTANGDRFFREPGCDVIR